MKIEQWELSKILPYEFNNRIHTEEQTKRIAKSITEFGFNQPIVVDENNIILVGHGRLLAAKELNLKEVPVLQIKDLSETKKRAYRILDNKLQNDSTWAFNNLELELGALEDEGFDLPEWGLDDLKGMFPEEEPEVADDEFEASEQDEIFIKEGDVIELGRHRVLCGDSTSAEDVAGLMDGKQAEACISDPPYGVEYVGKTSDALSIQGDSNTDVAVDGIKNALASIKDGGAIYICFPAEELLALSAMWEAPARLQSMLVWVKNTIVMGRKDYNYKHEPIWYGWKEGMAHRFKGSATNCTVLECDKPSRNGEHPTMKPLALMADLIKNAASKQEIIIDPFLGSGTTLIACEQLNRTCYGIEIDPKYCQVIIERYQKHCEKSGKPFECKINGEPFNFPSIKKDYEKAA